MQLYFLQYQLLPVKFFTFWQCIWIFVQTGGTKNILAGKALPMLPLLWLVSEKKVTIWSSGFTWSQSNKLLKHFESKYDAYLHMSCWNFFANIKVPAPPPFDSAELSFPHPHPLEALAYAHESFSNSIDVH